MGTAAGRDGGPVVAACGGARPKRGARTGAGAEVPDERLPGRLLRPEPASGVTEPSSEQVDVEHGGTVALLVIGEEIEEQCPDPALAEAGRHKLVTGTAPASTPPLRDRTHPPPPLLNHDTPV